VTDNLGNTFRFNESDEGDYVSDTLKFTGLAGNTYSLSIITPDNEKYESDYQLLLPEVDPDSLYAEFGYQETLSNITGLKVTEHGANILIDIKNRSDAPLRLRFMTKYVAQNLTIVDHFMGPSDYYYCWQTEDINPFIDLSGGTYTTNSSPVVNHDLGFIDDNLYYYSLINSQPMLIRARVIYLSQYTLNSDANTYYKKIDELIRSDGKLFDPIASQLIGNVKCLTHPDKKAFGFFETSSVSHKAYKLDFRNLNNFQPSITKLPYIVPEVPTGFLLNEIPPFWVINE
jgi:hypothetical protein